MYRIPWHIQPLKTLYLIGALLIIGLVYLPYWIIRYSWRSQRPSPKWSLTLTLVVRLVRCWGTIGVDSGIVSYFARDLTKLETDETLESSGNECRSIWLKKVDPDVDVVGEVKEWMVKNDVQPIDVPGYWWGARGPKGEVLKPSKHEKVVLHLHGGGYVHGSAHPKEPVSNLARGLIHYALLNPSKPIRRLLAVDYRLCRAAPLSKPANPFPSQLIDSLAGYIYLVRTVGFSPSNIIISGDSAGGNLALALTRYLRDARIPDLVVPPILLPPSPIPSSRSSTPLLSPGHLPSSRTSSQSQPSMICGLLLQSPWCDPAATHNTARLGPTCSFARNANSDIIERGTDIAPSVYGLRGLMGKAMDLTEAGRNAYISPGSLDLPGEPTAREIGGSTNHLDALEKGDHRPNFDGYPRTYFAVGGREVMNDEIRTTAARIMRDSAPGEHSVLASSSFLTNASATLASGSTCSRLASFSKASVQSLGKVTDAGTDDDGEKAPVVIDVCGPLEEGEGELQWVTIKEEPEMFHDWCIFGVCEPARGRALEGMVKWIAALPGGENF